jgi:3-phenylpropionate/trans-cinnamate dioxygenase ferredoxin component
MGAFHRVVELDKLSVGEPMLVQTPDGRAVVLRLSDTELTAYTPICPHQMGNLSGAPVINGAVVCPVHDWRFDVRSGACLRPGEEMTLRLFAVQVCDGWVEVAVPRPKWLED